MGKLDEAEGIFGWGEEVEDGRVFVRTIGKIIMDKSCSDVGIRGHCGVWDTADGGNCGSRFLPETMHVSIPENWVWEEEDAGGEDDKEGTTKSHNRSCPIVIGGGMDGDDANDGGQDSYL